MFIIVKNENMYNMVEKQEKYDIYFIVKKRYKWLRSRKRLLILVIIKEKKS